MCLEEKKYESKIFEKCALATCGSEKKRTNGNNENNYKFQSKMYCGKDCSCSLCRELHNYKPAKPTKRPAPRPPTSLFGRFNENFILRRRSTANSFKTFQPQSLKCSEMFQQRATETATPNSCTQLPQQQEQQQQHQQVKCKGDEQRFNRPEAPPKPNHKVVIYFGDSIANRGKHNIGETAKDVVQAAQLLDDTARAEDSTECLPPIGDEDLPSYIESIQNGVINIKIEGNYQRASALVETVAKPTRATVQLLGDAEESVSQQSCDSCDWSFVQEWRARYGLNCIKFLKCSFIILFLNVCMHIKVCI